MDERSNELLRDIAARRAQIDAGDGPTMWQSPERPRNMIYKTHEAPQQDWSGWDRWAEAHIARALAEQPVFSKAQVSAIGEALATIRSEIRKEFATEIASLRADMNVQTGIARGEISRLQGSVGLKRGRNAA
jgi:hypothetical protein